MLKVHQQFVEPENLMWRLPLGTPHINAEFARFDIEFVPSPDNADVILKDCRLVDAATLTTQPHVLLDSIDQATLANSWCGQTRTLSQLPQVKRIIKSLYYDSVETQNEVLYECTRFSTLVITPPDGWVQQAGELSWSPWHLPPITATELAKLTSICNPLWADCFQYLCKHHITANTLQSHRRLFDAVFLGAGGWYSPESVRTHRAQCVKAIRELSCDMIVCSAMSVSSQEARARTPDWPGVGEHFDLLLRSRVCVSPWGFSEHSIRDYEAALAGCILVKPAISHLATWPDVINDPATILCKPDFSDLDAIVRDVMEHWDKYEQLAIARANRLWQLVRTPDAMLDRWSTILHAAANARYHPRITPMPEYQAPQQYPRPVVGVGVVSWACHPVRTQYLEACLESLKTNLRSTYSYDITISLEPRDASPSFDAAIDIAGKHGAHVLVHDEQRGYAANIANLVENMPAPIKLILEDDHVLPSMLDLTPFIAFIATDPTIGFVALGESGNGYVLDEENTPPAWRHLVTLLSPDSKWYFSNGIHLRTPRLTQEAGIYSQFRDLRAEWHYNEHCKQAAREGRLKAYVAKTNYRATIGTWSTCADHEYNLFRNQPPVAGGSV